MEDFVLSIFIHFWIFTIPELKDIHELRVTTFVHATRKRSQKVPTQKAVCLGSPGWIPMIQAQHLQYETGTKFFPRAVPKLHTVKK